MIPQGAAKSFVWMDFAKYGTAGPTHAHSTIMIRLKSPLSAGIMRAIRGGALVLAVCSLPALGQGRPFPIKGKLEPAKGKIMLPPGFAPPIGMCRIWIDGVPAEQQPAPTDCATAVKNRPPNGRVIFSDEKATPAKTSKKEIVEIPSL